MKRQAKYYFFGFLAAALLVAFDQWTKYLAVLRLKGQAPFVIWEGVFELHYLENRGAAFGILQGQKIFFLLCTALVLALLILYYRRLPEGRRYLPLRLVSVLLAAGAVGNLIDRLSHSYVVDFFYFKLIDFPVFNVADCYVTGGAALLALLILFVYKEHELGFLSLRKKAADVAPEEQADAEEADSSTGAAEPDGQADLAETPDKQDGTGMAPEDEAKERSDG